MTLRIIADDYGLGEAHDAVMRDLLAAGAIDGVSVLADRCSPVSARALVAAARPNQRIGLHLNLTLARPDGPPRPTRGMLMARAAIGLDRTAARTALADQWDRFVALFGRPPDHLDGHEHCHAFPGIDRIAVAFARDRGVALRSMVPVTLPRGLKGLVLALLARELAAARTFAARAEGEIWLMVHPGAAGDLAQVPGHAPALRAAEAAFLARQAGAGAPG